MHASHQLTWHDKIINVTDVMEHLCQSVIYVNESATDFIIGVTRIFSGGALSPPPKKKSTIKKVDDQKSWFFSCRPQNTG